MYVSSNGDNHNYKASGHCRHYSSLTDIHSEVQAISSLYKIQEEFPDMYTYIKFPFGIMDYDGLKSKNVTKYIS